jgi:hypothetical protein
MKSTSNQKKLSRLSLERDKNLAGRRMACPVYHSVIILRPSDQGLNQANVVTTRAGKKNFLPGSTTWRQKFPADQRSIFVLNLHVHKHIVF